MRVYQLEEDDCVVNDTENGEELARFAVLYAKPSTRKHKKWEGDAVLVCYAREALLLSEDGEDVITRSTAVKQLDQLKEGKEFRMGGWEVQVQEMLATTRTVPPKVPPKTSVRESDIEPPTKIAKMVTPPVKKPLSFAEGSKKGFVCPVQGHESSSSTPLFVLGQSNTNNSAEKSVCVDKLFNSHLRDHQKVGVKYIYDRLKDPSSGVILADDMGLGKSLQTIASTWALLKSQNSSLCSVSKCLVIVPSSLVRNWIAEFNKWFRNCRTPAMMVRKASDIRIYSTSFRANPYLVISYEMALRCARVLDTIKFDIIVCDEGHRLKNSKSKLHDTLSSLNISRRLLLTGTPLQNDMEEFHSLLNFVNPGRFGTLPEFLKNSSENPEEMKTMLDDTMLRRSSQINNSHLPPKHEYVLFCKPSLLQKHLFTAICEHMTGEALVLLDLMKKVSNYPGILYRSLQDSKKQDPNSKYASLLAAFPADYGSRPPVLSDSGKLVALVDMLKSIRLMDECCVIVSNYTKTLDMIEMLCASLQFFVMRIDGAVSVADRQKLVNRFNETRNPNNIFLLSTKAGGVGLNLIAASRLILFDSDWNPANDLQAMARIWRDGQTRPCHIYRLITTGLIDEKILQRQIKKTGLCNVFDVTEICSDNVAFRDEDLQDIFSLVETSDCNTHDILECQCGGSGVLPEEMEDDDEEQEENVENDVEHDETTEDAPETSVEPDEAPPTISMAALFRWRHFSPSCPMAWNNFTHNAGLDTEMSSLSFAFQLSSNY